ncbi:3930_t:CDS:1, partial [Gigaspora rosea]
IPKQQTEQDNINTSPRETNSTTQKRQNHTNECEITPIMKLTMMIPIIIIAPETTIQHRWPNT